MPPRLTHFLTYLRRVRRVRLTAWDVVHWAALAAVAWLWGGLAWWVWSWVYN